MCLPSFSYTSIGGASAVIYTEVMQTFVLILGGLCVLGLGLSAVGKQPLKLSLVLSVECGRWLGRVAAAGARAGFPYDPSG